MTFSTSTIGYYHIQLIPIVALPLATALATIVTRVFRSTPQQPALAIFLTASAILLLLGFSFLNVRNSIYTSRFETPQTAKSIGNIVHHSTKTVFLAYHYGLPLEYYGEIDGTYWQRSLSYWLYRKPGERQLSIQERLDTLEYTPDYFIITDFAEYRNHHNDLREYLRNHCALIAESELYLIYGNCQP